jgi:hypothetical protein
MRIPVLLVVKSHEQFRASARALMNDMTMGLKAEKAPTYPGVTLDSGFAAVPLGGAKKGGPSLAAATPEESEYFIVRGHMEAKHQKDVPHKAGDAQVFSDPAIAGFAPPTCGGTPPVGRASRVATRLNVARLRRKHLDGKDVAVAIVDTGINLAHLTAKLGHAPALDVAASWTPPGAPPPPAPGAWPVDHGTMCAFDALIAAPKTTLVDFPVLSANFPGGGSIMSGTLSAAIAAYGFMLTSRASGRLRRYHALVASNSWGIFHPSWDFPAGHPGRYCDNPNHPFNLQIAAVTRAGIDVLFAAGNCGAPCADGRCRGRTTGAIMGASAVQEVLTIAGCDTNNRRVGYSSQGPSISGMFRRKPDVTSYTHFLGSEAFGAGTPDSGTSAACPVAAGVVAALRTSPLIPPGTLPTAQLFDQLRRTARQHPGLPGLWNSDYGFGIVAPSAAATALGL